MATMRSLRHLSLLALLTASALSHAQADTSSSSESYPLRLITYNIRTKTSTPKPGELLWADRRPLLAAQLDDFTSGHPNALLCLQEAFADVIDDIQDDLGDPWAHVGVGRDDGRRRGESAPVFYNTDEWALDHHQTYWLSEDPDEVGSRGWDASAPRIVTVARLTSTRTGDPVVYECTHFDHRGQRAKVESAGLLVDIAHYDNAVGDASTPVFVAGDLNLRPDNEALAVLRANLTEVRDLVARQNGDENGDELLRSESSFTGFSRATPRGILLDYMFVKDPASVADVEYTLASNEEAGEFVSDHKPLVADVTVRRAGAWEPREGSTEGLGHLAGTTGGGRDAESAAQRLRPGMLLLGDLLRYLMPLGGW